MTFLSSFFSHECLPFHHVLLYHNPSLSYPLVTSTYTLLLLSSHTCSHHLPTTSFSSFSRSPVLFLSSLRIPLVLLWTSSWSWWPSFPSCLPIISMPSIKAKDFLVHPSLKITPPGGEEGEIIWYGHVRIIILYVESSRDWSIIHCLWYNISDSSSKSKGAQW